MEIFDEASALHKAGKFEEALDLYDKILSQNHNNTGLLATMGTLFLQTNKLGLAISFLERVIEKYPQSDVLSNLGLAYKNSGQRDKAFAAMTKSCEKDATPEALSNYAGMFTQTANPEKAMELCRRAIEKKPELAIAHWNLALALLESGQWDPAWDEHEWGLKTHGIQTPMRVDRKIFDAPYWDGTKDSIVAVYGEQGIGDEIMFASMIPDLMKTNTVIIECHKRLKTLFEKSFPGVPIYGTREDTAITWPNNHKIDHRISIGSLGKFFRRSKEDFPGTPYLISESAPKGKKFRIGISWSGGQKASRVQVRTVPLAWWKPILNNDVEFISLQYTDCSEELSEMRKRGYDIKEFDGVKAEDYYETAKLVKSCDLVISVCTSVIHLAGALGVPCWVMVPNKPAWRYQVKGPMPWYRSVRLYRQTDSWLPVVERIGEDLREIFDVQEEKVA